VVIDFPLFNGRFVRTGFGRVCEQRFVGDLSDNSIRIVRIVQEPPRFVLRL